MAKFLLKAGAEVDFLTEDELGERLDAMSDFFVEFLRGQEGETITRAAGSFTTDANGNTIAGPYNGYGVYRVPTGYDALLTRFTIDYEGSSAASPQSCDLRVCADYNTPAGLRAIYNQVPAIFDASKSHAPIFRSGQLVVVSLQGGPHTTAMYTTVQVVLTARSQRAPDTAAVG